METGVSALHDSPLRSGGFPGCALPQSGRHLRHEAPEQADLKEPFDTLVLVPCNSLKHMKTVRIRLGL